MKMLTILLFSLLFSQVVPDKALKPVQSFQSVRFGVAKNPRHYKWDTFVANFDDLEFNQCQAKHTICVDSIGIPCSQNEMMTAIGQCDDTRNQCINKMYQPYEFLNLPNELGKKTSNRQERVAIRKIPTNVDEIDQEKDQLSLAFMDI